MKWIRFFLIAFVFLVSCQAVVPEQNSAIDSSEASNSVPKEETTPVEEESIYYLPENPYGENASVEQKVLFSSPVKSDMTPIPEVILSQGVEESYRLVFPADAGTPVKAVCPGTVVMVQNKRIPDMDEEELKLSMLGKFVVVSVGDGLSIRYAHLSEASAVVGQEVAVGDELGVVGDTGVALLQSHQPICGIYVIEQGLQVNPLLYFEMPKEFTIQVK